MLFKEELKNKRLYLDGGCGTLLQQKGLAPGELPELWSLSHRQDMIEIHKSYFDAGTNIVCSNTFGANTLKFGEKTEEIIAAAIENAKEAAKLSEIMEICNRYQVIGQVAVKSEHGCIHQ